MERLKRLLTDAKKNSGPWIRGSTPEHYKRISVDMAEADRLAVIGATELLAAYNMIPYFSQAVIAGAALSGDYDTLVIVTPSQYGKSYLLARIALLLAYNGHAVSVAGSTTPTTDIILGYTRKAVQTADAEIKAALIGETARKIDKLDASLSKSRIGFAQGGYVEALTLGDSYNDISHNKAVGRGTDYIVDEAALASDKALQELGRRDLASTDGKKHLLIMVSNPHKPGAFYDRLTGNADDRTLILWMDALTAAQEGRWTANELLSSDFAKNEDTRTRYLMCELPQAGRSMFGPLTIAEKAAGAPQKHFLGVDAAYKGKDSICLCDAVRTPQGLHIESVVKLDKRNWIDGKTDKDIIREVIAVYKGVDASMVCVDIGQGIWLVQGLAGKVNVRGINFGAGADKERVRARHYAATNAVNMRAEMHLDLQSLIECGKITFSQKVYDAISDCLPYIKAERKPNGKLQVMPKEELKAIIGRSPDELDAVLLAIHAAILDTAY